MCSLILLRRPEQDWPLLLAGNRDERRDRTWRPPARHWEDRPEVVAGLDELGGGSWLGLNDHGLVAVVMNREGSLGPAPGKRSRGELVLEALDHAEASQAAGALAELNPAAYRPFNLLVADPVEAYWLRHADEAGAEPIQARPVSSGLHMLAACEMDDLTVPRIRTYLPLFRDAPVPDPAEGDWGAWRALLSSRVHPQEAGPAGAMNVDLAGGFGTVCSHLIAIPRYPGPGSPARFLFAAGPPDRADFAAVAL